VWARAALAVFLFICPVKWCVPAFHWWHGGQSSTRPDRASILVPHQASVTDEIGFFPDQIVKDINILKLNSQIYGDILLALRKLKSAHVPHQQTVGPPRRICWNRYSSLGNPQRRAPTSALVLTIKSKSWAPDESSRGRLAVVLRGNLHLRDYIVGYPTSESNSHIYEAHIGANLSLPDAASLARGLLSGDGVTNSGSNGIPHFGRLPRGIGLGMAQSLQGDPPQADSGDREHKGEERDRIVRGYIGKMKYPRPDRATDKAAAAFFAFLGLCFVLIARVAGREDSAIGVIVCGGIAFFFFWAAVLSLGGRL